MHEQSLRLKVPKFGKELLPDQVEVAYQGQHTVKAALGQEVNALPQQPHSASLCT